MSARRLSIALLGCLTLSAGSSAAQQEKARQEERVDHYARWLEQDVVYILSREERAVFLSLQTDQERDSFIEQFWFRRDPDPSTADNEFKEEHYRRIAYANDKFTAGVPGWRSDRGRIYIAFGPPDRVEGMPAGGSYHRKRSEGGGFTSVFPFEIWEYRHIEGVGSDVELEFVDDEGGGLYELTYDPQRKDELIHTGFLGPTLDEIENWEATGSRSKQYRVAGRRWAGDPAGIYKYSGYFEFEKDKPFSRLILSGQINKGPGVTFKDLQEVVETAVRFEQIHFWTESAAFHTAADQALVTLTLQIPHESLTFKTVGNIRQAQARVLGRVQRLDGRTESLFEEVVSREVPVSERLGAIAGSSLFQKRLLLPAGLFKVDLAVKDVESGRIGTSVFRIEVPLHAEDRLSLSSLVLAQEIAGVDGPEVENFQIGSLRIVPRVSGQFRQDEDLGFYFQIYNPGLDQSTGQADLKVEFAITAAGGAVDGWRDCSRLATQTGGYLKVARLTSLHNYPPGRYALRVRATDRLTGREASREVPVEILP